MKLTVQLLTWNSEKYLPSLFASLRQQTFRGWELLILDNNSEENSIAALKQELDNFSIQHKLILNKENIGFAGGHNKLFKQSDSDYFLMLNHDLVLEPDCLEKLVAFLDVRQEVCAVAPRLLRSDKITVDSLGLKVFRNRRVTDMGSGRPWVELAGEYQDKNFVEVFGVSGTMPMVRRQMVKNILDNDNFLDDALNSYKEDVDLAYRLSSAGLKTCVVLDATAYHHRTGRGDDHNNDAVSAKNKKQQPAHVAQYSYRNHLIVLYKNEYWQNFALDFPWILWYELKKFVWFLLFDRSVLKGLRDIWMQRKELRNKRREIRKKKKVDWLKMRKWLN